MQKTGRDFSKKYAQSKQTSFPIPEQIPSRYLKEGGQSPAQELFTPINPVGNQKYNFAAAMKWAMENGIDPFTPDPSDLDPITNQPRLHWFDVGKRATEYPNFSAEAVEADPNTKYHQSKAPYWKSGAAPGVKDAGQFAELTDPVRERIFRKHKEKAILRSSVRSLEGVSNSYDE